MNFSDLTSHGGIFCDGDWIEKKDQDPNGNVRLIQLADIGVAEFKDKSHRYITEDKAIELHCTYLQKGDILIARLPDPLGRACIFPLDGKYITAVDIAVVRIAKEDYNSKYIMYMINSPQFRNEIKKYESGTTRKRISRKNLDKIQFNVPSRIEQDRIVSRIEELFSQLDNGIETLQKTNQQLDVYRQAVYSSLYNNSSLTPITDFFDISGGLTKNSKREMLSIKMPYLRVANVYYNRLDLTEIKIIGVTESEVKKTLLKKEDLLFVEGNGSKDQIGRVAVWDGSITNCVHQNHLIKARPLGNMLSKYALYYFISSYGRKQILKVASSTSGLYTLSTNKIKNLRIPFTSIENQLNVINEIDARISTCLSIEKSIHTTLQQADALRQSILKKAFEGRI